MSLNQENHRQEAADLIRSLIQNVVLTPKENEPGLHIDLKGDLAGILTMAASRKSASERHELVKQMQEISKELLNPSLLESLNLQTNMENGAVLNKEDDTPSQYQLVAGVRCKNTLQKQDLLVAGVRNCFTLLFNHTDAPTRRKYKLKTI